MRAKKCSAAFGFVAFGVGVAVAVSVVVAVSAVAVGELSRAYSLSHHVIVVFPSLINIYAPKAASKMYKKTNYKNKRREEKTIENLPQSKIISRNKQQQQQQQ